VFSFSLAKAYVAQTGAKHGATWWLTAAILKTVKSPYLRNRFNDIDEIWHADAHRAFTAD